MPARQMLVLLVVVALTAAACNSGGGESTEDTGSTVAVTGTNALAFEPESLTASAGTVTVELMAEDAAEHTFVVEEIGDTEVVAAAAGETSSGSVELEPGTYTFYCDIPGHRPAGMEGELTVESTDGHASHAVISSPPQATRHGTVLLDGGGEAMLACLALRGHAHRRNSPRTTSPRAAVRVACQARGRIGAGHRFSLSRLRRNAHERRVRRDRDRRRPRRRERGCLRP